MVIITHLNLNEEKYIQLKRPRLVS